jgi:hypothetical protein
VLTEDWLTPIAEAAWRKFKCSATAKAWISETSGIREPNGDSDASLGDLALWTFRKPVTTRRISWPRARASVAYQSLWGGAANRSQKNRISRRIIRRCHSVPKVLQIDGGHSNAIKVSVGFVFADHCRYSRLSKVRMETNWDFLEDWRPRALDRHER